MRHRHKKGKAALTRVQKDKEKQIIEESFKFVTENYISKQICKTLMKINVVLCLLLHKKKWIANKM